MACPGSDRFDPSTQQCEQAPFLDIIACPLYAPACTLQYNRIAPGKQTTESVALRNTGVAPLHVQSAVISGGGPFTLAQILPVTIAAQDILELKITFAPTKDGFFTGTLTVQSDAIVTTPMLVPIRAATVSSGCTETDGCLIGEICAPPQCSPCPTITPPACMNGRVVLSGAVGTCQQPTCQCDAPLVFNAAMGGCVSPP